jgi:hypothetical protein
LQTTSALNDGTGWQIRKLGKTQPVAHENPLNKWRISMREINSGFQSPYDSVVSTAAEYKKQELNSSVTRQGEEEKFIDNIALT